MKLKTVMALMCAIFSCPFLLFSCQKTNEGNVEEVKKNLNDTLRSGLEYRPLTVEYERNGWKTATGVRVIDSMNWYTAITPQELAGKYAIDKWGGRTDLKSVKGATGFFSVEEINGRWYYISPDGTPLIIKGTQYMHPITKANMGVRMTSAFQSRFKSDNKLWAKETSDLMLNNGFNCLSIWSTAPAVWPADVSQSMKKPYNDRYLSQVESINILKQFYYTTKFPSNKLYNMFILLFDDQFPASADAWVKKYTPLFKNDPHFLGYYLDNELPFYTAEGSFGYGNPANTIDLVNFLDLPDELPAGMVDNFKTGRINARAAAEAFLVRQGKTRTTISDADRFAFITFIAEKYYSMAAALVRKYDPNHLILGSRLHHDSKFLEGVVRECAKNSDVISLNYYNMWEPDPNYLNQLKSWTGNKPIMITEFYTKGKDALLPEKTGAGWPVRTQADRGRFYQNFCMLMLEAKNCVGWTHFSYSDYYEEDGSGSEITANKGMVNQDFEPYWGLLNRMGQFNKNVYKLIDYIDLKPKK